MGYEKTEMKMKMAAKRYRCMGKATATPIISRFSYANDLWMAKICRGKYYIFGKYCRYIAQQECVCMCLCAVQKDRTAEEMGGWVWFGKTKKQRRYKNSIYHRIKYKDYVGFHFLSLLDWVRPGFFSLSSFLVCLFVYCDVLLLLLLAVMFEWPSILPLKLLCV